AGAVPVGPDGGGLLAFPVARRSESQAEPAGRPRLVAAGVGVVLKAGGEDEAGSRRRPEAHADEQPEPGTTAGPPPGVTPGAGSGDAASATSSVARSGACADESRLAGERCDLADRLREQSVAANQRLHERQRAYDDLAARAARAALAVDPREVRSAKEAARQAFRRAHAAAHSREAGETAARDWLTEINRVNQSARDAGLEASRARAASAGLALAIERLGLEADVARINAESAAEACHAAREVLAACEEARVDRRAGRRPVEPAPPQAPVEAARPRLIGGPELDGDDVDEITPPAERVFAGVEPRILRMLRGDGDAVRLVVQDVADDDPAEQRRWQLLLSNLVDACVARAIEASSLEFPAEHPFWGPFSQAQNRDIATALGSLGYRFDGLGGMADGRIPSQRDLSLALGYAGLDPMRLRTWPNEAMMPRLFEDVRVAADEFVAAAAPDLSLGEMVALLGGRAEPLADLWNNWGRVRAPLLEA
ncbi:MAG: hypothetical protein ACRDGQ_11930, partial [Candidatus Limnocylindrales bacterium]